jgi:hypothetical protein
MEILIPGLILVALMVYVSTKIKKNAVDAFAEETITTDDFILVKPDGFLHNLNGDPALLFEAYSKDFGTGDDQDVRQATIEMRKITGQPFDSVCDIAKNGAIDVIERKGLDVGDLPARSIEVERETDGRLMTDHFFIIDAKDEVFELKTSALKEFNGDYLQKIDRMEDSVQIKNR